MRIDVIRTTAGKSLARVVGADALEATGATASEALGRLAEQLRAWGSLAATLAEDAAREAALEPAMVSMSAELGR